MIKLIATDMDGTLLNSNNEIQHGFYDVFEKIQEKGIIFAAASGRQYYNLLERFKGIEDKMMFIAENGTFVVYEGKELVVNSLDINLARELIKVGRQIENSYVILCGKNSAYRESIRRSSNSLCVIWSVFFKSLVSFWISSSIDHISFIIS